MKKKILALILVIVMALSLLPMSALAAPDISATYSKSAKTVTVTVDGVTEKVPNVNNNSTVTVEVNGWKVIVDAKNDVATIKSKEKLASTVDTNEEVGTAIESKDTTTNLRTFRMEQTWNKTTYHCGYEQGGPRVVPTEYTGTPALNTAALKNNTKIWLNLQEVPGTTKWELVSVEIDGAIYTAPVCPKCGSTEWVSFSNNSGEPDGKNMQMCHREHGVQIIKYWDDDNNPNRPEAVFDIYKYDANAADYHGALVIEGARPNVKYTLIPGKYVVEERPKPGYVVQPDEILTVGEDDVLATVAFTNELEVVDRKFGVALDKWVDGVPFAAWWSDGDINPLEVIDMISFELYQVEDENTDITDGTFLGYGALDADGKIGFGTLEVSAGWYAVVEVLTDEGKKVFNEPDPLYIYVGETSSVEIDVTNALYLISGNGGNVGEVVTSDWRDGGTLQDCWTDNLANIELYDELAAIASLYEVELAWVWEYAEADNNAHGYKWSIDKEFYLGNTIVTDENGEVPIYFGADDAVVVWINGQVAAYSQSQLNRGADDVFTWKPLGEYQQGADGGFRIYRVDVSEYLIPNARNTITIDVMNQKAPPDGEGVVDGNPSGVLLFLEVAYKDVVFNNTTVIDPKFGVTLDKWVDGVPFADWWSESDGDIDPLQIIDMITFKLYAVEFDGDDSYIGEEPLAIGVLDNEGKIGFGTGFDVPAGWYVVVEELNEDGKKIFVEVDPVYIEVIDDDVTGDFNNTSRGSIEVDANVGLFEDWISQTHKTEFQTTSYNKSLSSFGELFSSNWFRVNKITESTQIEIAQSGQGQDGFASLDPPYFYDVTINGDTLTISFDKNLISAEILANVFGSKPSKHNTGGHKEIVTGDTLTFDITGMDEIWLEVHFEALKYYTTDTNGYRIPYCVVDSTDSGTRVYTGSYAPDITYSIDGGVTKVADGKFESLAPGSYTVKIYVDGAEYAEETLVVKAGEKTEFTFNVTITVNNGNPVKIVECERCDVWL